MRLRWFCCCVPFVLLFACGDAAKPEPVDPDNRLVDLSSDETARLCGAMSERFDGVLSGRAYLDASCTQQAWPISFDVSNTTGEFIGSPKRCRELVEMCLEKDGALGDFSPTESLGADLVDRERCNLPAPGLELDACDATVADLDACTAAVAAKLGKRLADADCELLGDMDALQNASPALEIAQLAECQGLLTRCPIFTLDTLPDGRPPSASD